MKTEKEKLQAKTVEQLKRYAKKVGAKIVTPEGKAKTKDQLVNSIVMKERLSGKSLGAKPAAKKLAAKKPAAKKLAAKLVEVPEIKSFKVVNLGPTNKGVSRIRLTDMVSGESIAIPFTGRKAFGYQEAILYLKGLGIKVVAKARLNNGTVLLYTKDFGPRLKK
jgi:hypothetical protein